VRLRLFDMSSRRALHERQSWVSRRGSSQEQRAVTRARCCWSGVVRGMLAGLRWCGALGAVRESACSTGSVCAAAGELAGVLAGGGVVTRRR